MNTKQFENQRWSHFDSEHGFRQKTAARLVEGRILDLGCGDGVLFDVMGRPQGMVGLDISEEGIKKAQDKGMDARVFDFAGVPLPFAEGAFETVVILDVLEHLYDPGTVLAEAARASSAWVVAGVPNFNSLPARIQVWKGNVPENNSPRKGHVYWFNKKVLEQLMKKAGLDIVEVRANTFWQAIPILGPIVYFLSRRWPSVFALSFVVKAKKK